jgi:hypothetical protein
MVKGRGKKLTWDDVEQIRIAHVEGVSNAQLAEKFKVDVATIRSIIAERSWKGPRPDPRKSGRSPANKTIAPAEDKLWDNKRRNAIRRPPRGQPLTVDQYNLGYQAYTEEQTARHVARVLDIDPRTARRLIEEGYPDRGLRPYRLRYEKVLQQAQIKEDYDLAKARSELLLISRMLLTKLAARIQAMQASELDADKIATNVKTVQAVMERALGAADQTIDHTVTDRYANWTDEEMLAFAQTGQLPARLVDVGSPFGEVTSNDKGEDKES